MYHDDNNLCILNLGMHDVTVNVNESMFIIK